MSIIVGNLTYTTEKHSEVHDADGPPSTLVVLILRIVSVKKGTGKENVK